MKSYVLFSGGKDSSLTAYMLKKLDYSPILITANFGIVPDAVKTAEEATKAINIPIEILKMDSGIIEKAAEMSEKDGFPNNGINYVHHQVLEKSAEVYGPDILLSDGCRRDDRTPKVTFNEMRSLEDRHNSEYFSPLTGMSYKTINYLSDKLFILDSIKAGAVPTSEYETEIRAVLREKDKKLELDIFPAEHYHSIVKGLKNGKK